MASAATYVENGDIAVLDFPAPANYADAKTRCAASLTPAAGAGVPVFLASVGVGPENTELLTAVTAHLDANRALYAADMAGSSTVGFLLSGTDAALINTWRWSGGRYDNAVFYTVTQGCVPGRVCTWATLEPVADSWKMCMIVRGPRPATSTTNTVAWTSTNARWEIAPCNASLPALCRNYRCVLQLDCFSPNTVRVSGFLPSCTCTCRRGWRGRVCRDPVTATAIITNTNTTSMTQTVSQSLTLSTTHSFTASRTPTATSTASFTVSATPSKSMPITRSPAVTATRNTSSHSASRSAAGTFSRSIALTATRVLPPTASDTRTARITDTAVLTRRTPSSSESRSSVITNSFPVTGSRTRPVTETVSPSRSSVITTTPGLTTSRTLPDTRSPAITTSRSLPETRTSPLTNTAGLTTTRSPADTRTSPLTNTADLTTSRSLRATRSGLITPSRDITRTPNITASRTPRLSPTTTLSLSPALTRTRQRPPTRTRSKSAAVSQSRSARVTSSRTLRITNTNTATRSPIATLSRTQLITASQTPSRSAVASSTRTRPTTPTATLTRTAVSTPTRSGALTETPSLSRTIVPPRTETRQLTPEDTPSRTLPRTKTPILTTTRSHADSDTATLTRTGLATSTKTARITATVSLSTSTSASRTPILSSTRTMRLTESYSLSKSNVLTRTASMRLTRTRPLTPTRSGPATATHPLTASTAPSATRNRTVTITQYTEQPPPTPSVYSRTNTTTLSLSVSLSSTGTASPSHTLTTTHSRSGSPLSVSATRTRPPTLTAGTTSTRTRALTPTASSTRSPNVTSITKSIATSETSSKAGTATSSASASAAHTLTPPRPPTNERSRSRTPTPSSLLSLSRSRAHSTTQEAPATHTEWTHNRTISAVVSFSTSHVASQSREVPPTPSRPPTRTIPEPPTPSEPLTASSEVTRSFPPTLSVPRPPTVSAPPTVTPPPTATHPPSTTMTGSLTRTSSATASMSLSRTLTGSASASASLSMTLPRGTPTAPPPPTVSVEPPPTRSRTPSATMTTSHEVPPLYRGTPFEQLQPSLAALWVPGLVQCRSTSNWSAVDLLSGLEERQLGLRFPTVCSRRCVPFSLAQALVAPSADHTTPADEGSDVCVWIDDCLVDARRGQAGDSLRRARRNAYMMLQLRALSPFTAGPSFVLCVAGTIVAVLLIAVVQGGVAPLCHQLSLRVRGLAAPWRDSFLEAHGITIAVSWVLSLSGGVALALLFLGTHRGPEGEGDAHRAAPAALWSWTSLSTGSIDAVVQESRALTTAAVLVAVCLLVGMSLAVFHCSRWYAAPRRYFGLQREAGAQGGMPACLWGCRIPGFCWRGAQRPVPGGGDVDDAPAAAGARVPVRRPYYVGSFSDSEMEAAHDDRVERERLLYFAERGLASQFIARSRLSMVAPRVFRRCCRRLLRLVAARGYVGPVAVRRVWGPLIAPYRLPSALWSTLPLWSGLITDLVLLAASPTIVSALNLSLLEDATAQRACSGLLLAGGLLHFGIAALVALWRQPMSSPARNLATALGWCITGGHLIAHAAVARRLADFTVPVEVLQNQFDRWVAGLTAPSYVDAPLYMDNLYFLATGGHAIGDDMLTITHNLTRPGGFVLPQYELRPDLTLPLDGVGSGASADAAGLAGISVQALMTVNLVFLILHTAVTAIRLAVPFVILLGDVLLCPGEPLTRPNVDVSAAGQEREQVHAAMGWAIASGVEVACVDAYAAFRRAFHLQKADDPTPPPSEQKKTNTKKNVSKKHDKVQAKGRPRRGGGRLADSGEAPTGGDATAAGPPAEEVELSQDALRLRFRVACARRLVPRTAHWEVLPANTFAACAKAAKRDEGEEGVVGQDGDAHRRRRSTKYNLEDIADDGGVSMGAGGAAVGLGGDYFMQLLSGDPSADADGDGGDDDGSGRSRPRGRLATMSVWQRAKSIFGGSPRPSRARSKGSIMAVDMNALPMEDDNDADSGRPAAPPTRRTPPAALKVHGTTITHKPHEALQAAAATPGGLGVAGGLLLNDDDDDIMRYVLQQREAAKAQRREARAFMGAPAFDQNSAVVIVEKAPATGSHSQSAATDPPPQPSRRTKSLFQRLWNAGDDDEFTDATGGPPRVVDQNAAVVVVETTPHTQSVSHASSSAPKLGAASTSKTAGNPKKTNRRGRLESVFSFVDAEISAAEAKTVGSSSACPARHRTAAETTATTDTPHANPSRALPRSPSSPAAKDASVDAQSETQSTHEGLKLSDDSTPPQSAPTRNPPPGHPQPRSAPKTSAPKAKPKRQL